MRRLHPTAFPLLLVAFTASCSGAEPPGPPTDRTSETLYVASDLVWKDAIHVCFEDDGHEFDDALVRETFMRTWGRNSSASTWGWEKCQPHSAGIHIKWADINPKTQGLGTDLDGMTNGMYLNDTFHDWTGNKGNGPGRCTQSEQGRQDCVRIIAAHEFGHALGFSHEQNRSDTPKSCTEDAQGDDGDTRVDGWDADSIMNYCNMKWNNGGELSSGDKAGVNYYYPPRQPSLIWESSDYPEQADKIAATYAGGVTERLYAKNYDGVVYLNESRKPGPAGGQAWLDWQYATSVDSDARSFASDMNGIDWLYFTQDRHIYNNYGSPVGNPVNADQISVGRYDETPGAFNDSAGNYPLYFALNDDRTLYRSHTGQDGSWEYVGNPYSAARVVAASGTLGERLFALNDDGGIYMNHGDGCDDHWTYLGTVPFGSGKPVEIAAADANTLYIIDDDPTRGSSGERQLTRVEVLYAGTYFSPGKHCDGTSVVDGDP